MLKWTIGRLIMLSWVIIVNNCKNFSNTGDYDYKRGVLYYIKDDLSQISKNDVGKDWLVKDIKRKIWDNVTWGVGTGELIIGGNRKIGGKWGIANTISDLRVSPRRWFLHFRDTMKRMTLQSHSLQSCIFTWMSWTIGSTEWRSRIARGDEKGSVKSRNLKGRVKRVKRQE